MERWANFVLRKIQELEREKGRRISLEEASKIYGISRPTLSQWLSGKVEPSHFRVDELAEKFGMEVYAVLGYSSPEPELYYVNQKWEILPYEARRQIREIVDKYVSDSNDS